MWKKESNLFVMLSCAFGLAWALTGEASAVEAMRVSAFGVATASTDAGPLYRARLGAPRPGVWSGLRLDFPAPRDLSSVGLVRANLTNETDRSVRVYCKLRADTLQGRIPECYLDLPPNACRMMSLPIFAERWMLDRDLGLKALKRGPGVGKVASYDVTKTRGFVFYTEPSVGDCAFGVSNFTLVSSDGLGGAVQLKADSFLPWVDGFGQGNFTDWRGKVHSVDDLKAAAMRETAELSSSSPGIPQADRFGGWAGGPKLKATGFFRTEKVGGKWWIVDPDGHLFFSHGVGHYAMRQPTGISKREEYFESLPPDKGEARPFYATLTEPAFMGFYGKPENLPCRTFDFYGWNLFRKYGEDWRTRDREMAHRRARAWGLNTLSSGQSEDARSGASRIPYTVTISTKARRIAGAKGYWGSLTDFFSPEFEARVRKAVGEKRAAGTNEYCLGWFSDNEQSWGYSGAALSRAVLASPDDQPAKVEFLRRLGAKGIPATDVPEAELEAFGAALAERYYSTVRAAIKEVAPNALYLGDRIAWAFPDVYRAASRHVDILSVNVYDYTPSVDLPTGSADCPMVASEFHFGCYEPGFFYAGLIPVASQQARADAYRRYVEAALDHPRYVGTHWFMWYDCPTSGATWGGNANAQCGFVSIADVPYRELTDAVRATAAEMYPRRYGKAAEAAGGPFNRGRIPAHPDVVNPVPGQDRGNSSAAGNPRAREVVPPTKVMLFFDTEDYTCDRANDPIRDIAHILTAEGVRGNFNIVGYLALRLVELRRFDVIDALKPHVLGTQTLYHTRHPDIAELGDDPDYARSYRRTMIDEARGIGMIEAVLGEDRCLFACPPGNSLSPAAFDVYSDMGIVINAGTGFYGTKKADGSYWRQMLMRSDGKALGLWYFNQIHVPYYQGFGIQNDLMPGSDEKYRNLPKTLDDLARWDFVALYMHPMMAVKTQYWDAINYRGGNNVEWRKWKPAPDRDPADTAVYYERLRALIRAIKADGRFAFSDLEAYAKTFRARKTIGASDLPAIRTALLRDFGSIREPSWSVADCFQAAVRLLRGEMEYRPGKVYGFLQPPKGVATPVDVSAADLRTAAQALDLSTFLPPEIRVGSIAIGPADFLHAALDVLVTGAEAVRVTPREQLGSFRDIDVFERFRMGGTWMHSPEFKDACLTDRLRLQLWTLRFE